MYNDEDIRKELVLIDVKDINSSKDLHELLKKELEFPEFYGMNWSAFWDAISGLVELPKKVVFQNWEVLESLLPDDSQRIQELVNELNELFPDLMCELEYK